MDKKPDWLLILVYRLAGQEGLHLDLETVIGHDAFTYFDEGDCRAVVFRFPDKKATATAQDKIVNDLRVQHVVAREMVEADDSLPPHPGKTLPIP